MQNGVVLSMGDFSGDWVCHHQRHVGVHRPEHPIRAEVAEAPTVVGVVPIMEPRLSSMEEAHPSWQSTGEIVAAVVLISLP